MLLFQESLTTKLYRTQVSSTLLNLNVEHPCMEPSACPETHMQTNLRPGPSLGQEKIKTRVDVCVEKCVELPCYGHTGSTKTKKSHTGKFNIALYLQNYGL